MRYIELGKTGMRISHLSFGASSLGSVFRETNESKVSNLNSQYRCKNKGFFRILSGKTEIYLLGKCS